MPIELQVANHACVVTEKIWMNFKVDRVHWASLPTTPLPTFSALTRWGTGGDRQKASTGRQPRRQVLEGAGGVEERGDPPPTTESRPDPPDATHWSCRSMARATGTTHSFVRRVWRSCGLKPHLVRSFKVSTDPYFEEKLTDVVGLYLDPPDNTAVFSLDEKSSVQALDRT